MATEFPPVSRPLARTNEFQRRTTRYVWIAFLVALFLHLIGGGAIIYSGLGKRKPEVEVRLLPYKSLFREERNPLEMMNEPRELVDVPEHLRTEQAPEEPTRLFADKNAMSRNPEENLDLPEDLPYAEGEEPDIKTMEESEEGDQQHDPMGGTIVLSPRAGGMPDFSETEDIPQWSPDLILRPEYRGSRKLKDKNLDVTEGTQFGERELAVVPLDDLDERPKPEGATYKRHGKIGIGIGPGRIIPKYDNRVSVAKDFGDFSFSTVAWDYAPYLYELRERVKRRWYPPPAFKMGIVSGRVIVNFRVLPDGHVEGFQFLSDREDEAYQSLKTSSKHAIIGASPFSPLPYDFPDPFLEITATFFYRILARE